MPKGAPAAQHGPAAGQDTRSAREAPCIARVVARDREVNLSRAALFPPP
jgi:hypothetical protein